MKRSGPDAFLWDISLITFSVSFMEVGPFKRFNAVSFSNLYFSNKLSLTSGLLNLLDIISYDSKFFFYFNGYFPFALSYFVYLCFLSFFLGKLYKLFSGLSILIFPKTTEF